MHKCFGHSKRAATEEEQAEPMDVATSASSAAPAPKAPTENDNLAMQQQEQAAPMDVATSASSAAQNALDEKYDELAMQQATAAARIITYDYMLNPYMMKKILEDMGFITEGQSDEQLLNTYLGKVIGSDLGTPSNSEGIGPKFFYDSTIS